MRHLDNVEVGVATHTGRVRRTNEDDFLLCAPQSAAEMARVGWIIAIADGMGGAAGGAEASRTAVRAAVRPFLGAPESNGSGEVPRSLMKRGFQSAVAEVYTLSQENPNLAGMGTTLTVLHLLGDRVVLGHVGDTRCLRVRGTELAQLSVDHAVREPDNFLTRCIGAGQREVQADIAEHDARPGDLFLMISDGLWAVVEDDAILSTVEALPPQAAADELVRLANRNGGPDNCTVIILRILDIRADVGLVEVDLPAEEVVQTGVMLAADRPLVPSRWPWALLLVGLALLAVGIAKVTIQFDLLAWLSALIT